MNAGRHRRGVSASRSSDLEPFVQGLRVRDIAGALPGTSAVRTHFRAAVIFLCVVALLLLALPELADAILLGWSVMLTALALVVLLLLGYSVRTGLFELLMDGISGRGSAVERPGRIGGRLVGCVRAGRRDQLERLLRSSLPNWPIRVVYIRAAHELLDLREGATTAQQVGVPPGVTNHLVQEVDSAARVLGQSADRVAAVGAQGVEFDGMQQALDREAGRLERLTAAVQRAREALAELTLSGNTNGALEVAESVLCWLGQVAHEESY